MTSVLLYFRFISATSVTCTFATTATRSSTIRYKPAPAALPSDDTTPVIGPTGSICISRRRYDRSDWFNQTNSNLLALKWYNRFDRTSPFWLISSDLIGRAFLTSYTIDVIGPNRNCFIQLWCYEPSYWLYGFSGASFLQQYTVNRLVHTFIGSYHWFHWSSTNFVFHQSIINKAIGCEVVISFHNLITILEFWSNCDSRKNTL